MKYAEVKPPDEREMAISFDILREGSCFGVKNVRIALRFSSFSLRHGGEEQGVSSYSTACGQYRGNFSCNVIYIHVRHPRSRRKHKLIYGNYNSPITTSSSSCFGFSSPANSRLFDVYWFGCVTLSPLNPSPFFTAGCVISKTRVHAT